MTVYTHGQAAAILDVPRIVVRRIARKLRLRGEHIESVDMDRLRAALREGER